MCSEIDMKKVYIIWMFILLAIYTYKQFCFYFICIDLLCIFLKFLIPYTRYFFIYNLTTTTTTNKNLMKNKNIFEGSFAISIEIQIIYLCIYWLKLYIIVYTYIYMYLIYLYIQTKYLNMKFFIQTALTHDLQLIMSFSQKKNKSKYIYMGVKVL